MEPGLPAGQQLALLFREGTGCVQHVLNTLATMSVSARDVTKTADRLERSADVYILQRTAKPVVISPFS